jgi:Mannosyltransferase (PIG-V)
MCELRGGADAILIGRHERRRFGLPASDWSIAAMVLLIKAAVLGFGLLSFEIVDNEAIGSFSHILSIWNRWDGPQYVLIAQHGYGAAGNERLALVFFPLYPWLIRITALVIGDAVAAGFAVSAIASIIAGVALERLFAIDNPPRMARAAVWFLFIFPTSYFLHADYSESLFLAFVLTAFLAARRGQWETAGALGGFAALTRPNGILLLPALAVEAIRKFWQTRQIDWRWLWIAMIAVGFGVYLIVNYRITGDAIAFLRLEREHWKDRMVAPWSGIWTSYEVSRDYAPHDAAMIGMQVLFYLAVGLAGTVASGLMLPASYTVWMALNWLVFASQSWNLSTPRYTLVMFPLFVLIARLARNRYWNAAIMVWSLLWLGFFTSEFVVGHWAF